MKVVVPPPRRYARYIARYKDGRARTAAEFPIAAFVGAGVVGPVPELRGTGSPDFAQDWAWRPVGHPVQRLAAAASQA